MQKELPDMQKTCLHMQKKPLVMQKEPPDMQKTYLNVQKERTSAYADSIPKYAVKLENIRKRHGISVPFVLVTRFDLRTYNRIVIV